MVYQTNCNIIYSLIISLIYFLVSLGELWVNVSGRHTASPEALFGIIQP